MQWRKFSLNKIVHSKLESAGLSMPQISNAFQFWSLIIFGVPSLICSLFIFYQFLSDSTRRHALHNHAILLIIMTNVILILTDVSWMLDSLRRPEHILSATPAFCMIWWFLDFTLYNTQTVILAWASIERHILIFHSKYLTTKQQKIFYHYLPPVILMVYLLCFHTNVLIFPSCENLFDFNALQCGSNPCYAGMNFLSIWDTIVNCVIPTLIIAIFNLALLYRIIAQKKRLQLPIQWRKHRRMSMQLISLSGVYIFLNLPMLIITFIQLIQDKDPEVGFGSQLYFFCVTYSVTLSLPFVVCLNCLSLDKHRRIRISPTGTLVALKKSVAQEVVASIR
jgi:hypothetical protein